jgi:8-oxo-dGTP diphosphatase
MTFLKYTLCFLTYENDVLMLLRNKPPNKGLWNGVGGHIEQGETPYQACIREVYEETGFKINNAHFSGILTWSDFEIDNGGLYIFTANAPHPQFKPTNEGQLAWYPRDYMLSSDQVVSNIHYFGPPTLNNAPEKEYYCHYQNGKLIHKETRSLPNWVNIHAVCNN